MTSLNEFVDSFNVFKDMVYEFIDMIDLFGLPWYINFLIILLVLCICVSVAIAMVKYGIIFIFKKILKILLYVLISPFLLIKFIFVKRDERDSFKSLKNKY